jgi:hypothetical protein
VEIQPAMLPLAFSTSVIVLRAAGPLPEAQRHAIVRQLRSPFSLRFLRAHGMRDQLSVQCLLDVPVAIPV